jgi:hypothetical protein
LAAYDLLFSSGRDSTLQDSFDIHVETPNRGSTQRFRAIQAAKTMNNQTKSGIAALSSRNHNQSGFPLLKGLQAILCRIFVMSHLPYIL